jgi:micrococcal nuclease
MKKLAALLILAFILTGCAAARTAGGPAASKDSDTVKVSRVIDGDTFTIIDRGREDRVRMIGVDTPETVKPGSPVQPLGPQASSFTKKLIEGKNVRLEYDVEKRDRYGRLLAYVYLEDGSLVNGRLVEEGLAVTLTVPPNVKMADRFNSLQKKARQQKKGIWK